MDNISNKALLAARSRVWIWMRGLFLTETSLLLLIGSSVLLAAIGTMVKDTVPLATVSTPTARQILQSKPVLAVNTSPCIVHSASAALVSDRTCITVN